MAFVINETQPYCLQDKVLLLSTKYNKWAVFNLPVVPGKNSVVLSTTSAVVDSTGVLSAVVNSTVVTLVVDA